MKNERERGLGAASLEQVQSVTPTLGEIRQSKLPSTPAAAGGTAQSVPASAKSGVIKQQKVQSGRPTGEETGIIGDKPI